MRNKNRNTLISKDPQWQSRLHKSQQKDSDLYKNSQFGIINGEKLKQQYKFQMEMQKNPQSNPNFVAQTWWKLQDRVLRGKIKSSFQKTATGFHKQSRQYNVGNKFYETSINGFVVSNNRPLSKKQNRDKLTISKPLQSKLITQQDQKHLSEGKPVKCFRLSLEPSQKPQFSRRPETSKGQRKRGSQTNNNETFNQELMDELIPCVTEEQQQSQHSYSKKQQIGNLNNVKKKRTYPLSATNRKARDVGDLIKLNSNTHRRSVNDFIAPFDTAITPDFICLFANGK